MVAVQHRASTAKRARRPRKLNNAIAPVVETLEIRRLLSAGDLDTTFGTAGHVTQDFGSSAIGSTGAFEQSSGKLILAGIVGDDIGLARYNPNGTLDTTFDGDGLLTLDIASGDVPLAVKIRTDGKIVVAGDTNTDTTHIFAATLNDDGSLDTDFGGGVVLVDNVNPENSVSMVLSPTNDAYVLGSDNGDTVVIKFDSTALDTTWGMAGTLTLALSGGSDAPASIGMQSTGKLVISGTFTGAAAGITRLKTDGSIDTDFGNNGAVAANPNLDDTINAMTIDPSDRILLGGQHGGVDTSLEIQHLTTNGGVDTTFGGGDGWVDLAGDMPGHDLSGGPIAIDASQHIVMAGTFTNNSIFNVFVVRYNSSGNIDTSFGSGGSVQTNITGFDIPGFATIDGSGKIVVAGTTDTAMLGLRYLSDNAASPPVANAGPDQTVNEGQLVNFDGSGSTGTGTLFYAWDLDGDGQFDDAITQMTSFTYADNGPVTVSLKVTDSLSQVSTDSAVITVNNVDPALDTVQITSPINENDSATLSGTYHDAGSADTHTLDVDWDGDGIYEVTNLAVSGGTFNFNHQYLDDNPTGTSSDTFTVHVPLHDDDGGTTTGGASLTVNNVAPTVNPITGPASALVRQQTASFSGSFNDPGTADTQQVSWDFGDGNVIAYHPSTDSGALVPSHTYTTSGTFVVTLNVKDDDGGVGTNTFNITVVAAALQGGNLVVGGTDGNDVINLQTTSTTGQVKVLFNGVEFGRFIPTGSITVDAGAGNDQVTIAAGVAATTVYGRAGNDTIAGGSGNDTIDGGDDNDVIDGNNGDDSIVGGNGNDNITGGSGNDISRGGDGNDVITNNGGDDLLDGGIGNDTLNAGGGNDTAIGGDGNDSIVGGTGNDSLFGGNDNDTIEGGAGLDTIDGGAGNDVLDGQGDADIIVGGDGNDTISGGADRDIMIGGTGADSIVGNADEDILIAGTTDYDGNIVALTAIQAEWTSGHTYLQRTDNIQDGSGGGALNGSFFFNPDGPNPVTVHDDGTVDTLTGSAGTDWFFFNNDTGVHDVITDLKPAEVPSATDID